MSDYGPLPRLRSNQSVKYKGRPATITGCFWDTKEWRYEVHILRMPMKGYWTVREENLEVQ